MTLDVHAEDVRGVRLHFGFVVGQFDATRLAATSHLHLCLDHHGVSDTLGDGDGFVHGVGYVTSRYGNTELGEVLLALIFEQVH